VTRDTGHGIRHLMSKLSIEENETGVVLSVKVVPGSSKTAISGVLGRKLKVKVSAAPERGKANRELISFLSKILGVKKNCIEVISGHNKPHKRLRIFGISAEELIKKVKI